MLSNFPDHIFSLQAISVHFDLANAGTYPKHLTNRWYFQVMVILVKKKASAF